MTNPARTARPAGQLPAGQHLSNTPAMAFPVAMATGAGLIVSGDLLLMGWALRESSGAAVASVDFMDGGAASGLNLGSVGIAAAGGQHDWFGPQGIKVQSGLFVAVTGAVTGAVYYIDLARY